MRERKALLTTLSLGVFMGALDLGVLSPALPAIGAQFGVDTGALAWIFTLYLLVTVPSIAIAGTLADRYGRRPVYLGCIALFALGSILAIASPSYGIFLFARALQAFGAGGIFPVAAAAIGDVVPQEKRGSALGMVAAMWGLAAVIGPVFGGLITHFIAWRWIFVANIPLAAVVVYLANRHVPSNAPRDRGALDVGGLSLLCLGLLALAFGITGGNVAVAIFGVLVLAGFVAWERIAANPVIPTALFTTPQLAKTYGLELLIGILEGSLFFVPTVLVNAEHLSYAAAGGVAALGALTFVAVIPGAGRALDRIGSRDVLLVGTFFTEAGLAIFALGFASPWLAILSMLVAGFGFGALLGAPTRYIVTNEAPANLRATAVGMLSQFLIVGQILGAAMAGGIFEAAISEQRGYRDAYLAFCAVALAAMIVAATLATRTRERAAAGDAAAASQND